MRQMDLFLYGLKNCDTCRKALKALPQAKLKDVRVDGVPENVLDAALAQFGEALVNTRSTTWRGLTDAERATSPKALLLQHPVLMKRPVIAANDRLFIGWNNDIENEVKAIL